MPAKYSLDVSNLPLALLLLDNQWRITFANNLAEQLLSTSLQRLEGMSLESFFTPREVLKQLMERAQYAEMNISDHQLRLSKDQTPISLHLRTSGKHICLLLIPEANRLNMEQQSKSYEMAQVVSRIALEMAHEIKNPLAALRGICQWVTEHQLKDDLQEALSQMMANVDRIGTRIDHFLQLGPRADVGMKQVNIHSLLDDVMQPVPKGVTLQRVFDPSLPPILAHPQRLRQAIENLWQNAMESEPQYIEWHTRLATAAQLPQHRGMVLEVRITNDGHTIPSHLHASLFEPFVTSKARGSGLGLAVVQQVMIEHGGRIQFHSETGRTSFIIHLPLGPLE